MLLSLTPRATFTQKHSMEWKWSAADKTGPQWTWLLHLLWEERLIRERGSTIVLKRRFGNRWVLAQRSIGLTAVFRRTILSRILVLESERKTADRWFSTRGLKEQPMGASLLPQRFIEQTRFPCFQRNWGKSCLRELLFWKRKKPQFRREYLPF